MRHLKKFPITKDADRAALAFKILHNITIERVGDVKWDRLRDKRPTWAVYPCWLYNGKWEDGKGFKKIKFRAHTMYVHRASYELSSKGPIPDGLILDHLCRRHSCCQPEHLEPVTTAVNTERGNGGWVYGQCAKVTIEPETLTDAEILAAHIEHGHPRFVPLGRVVAGEIGDRQVAIETTRPEHWMRKAPDDRTRYPRHWGDANPVTHDSATVSTPSRLQRFLRAFRLGLFTRKT